MFEHILIPLDGSCLAECVLPHTVALAQAFKARVTLLHVMQTGRSRSTDPLGWHVRKAESRAYLEEVVARLQKAGVETAEALLEGPPAERITDFVRQKDVSLILLSSHGQSGLSGWNISSVVQKIILRAYIPTMIVPAYQPGICALGDMHYKRLLLPLDGSRRAECALTPAIALARFHETQILLAQVVRKPEVPRRVPLTEEERDLVDRLIERNRQEASRYLEELRARLSADVRTCLLVSDETTAALHRLVSDEQVDLVMLSAHGYTGGAQWPYGSIALSFIAYGTRPLLIVQDLSKDEVKKSEAEMATRERRGH